MCLVGKHTKFVFRCSRLFIARRDLRNNEIVDIEDGALQGAASLQDLLLSNNKLRLVRPKMFAGLRNMTTL